MSTILRVIKSDIIHQDWTVEQIVQYATPPGWESVFWELEDESNPNSLVIKQELKDISMVLQEDEIKHGTWFPLKKDLFKAFDLTPLTNVRVVIIGQNPYPQTNLHTGLPRAQGLSFSVSKDDDIPSSLRNIFTELKSKSCIPDYPDPMSGDLTGWARQGVFLLNSCLTVRPNQPESHGQVWMPIIRDVLQAIAEANPTAIYLLWGKPAQSLRKYIGERSIILTAAHPSGLSARRGFFGSCHFRQVNEILMKRGEAPIDWGVYM